MFLTSSILASLRFFEAAARLLSFRQAAAELHVTQGAVSQQIKHLEASLGTRLFLRLPRQIALTDEGKRFAAVVSRSLDEIRREAGRIAAVPASIEIRVRAAPSFALRWLVPRLGDFYARHPDIKLFIVAAYGSFDPGRREFDLAIDEMPGGIAGMRSEVLMVDYLMPVCSPKYLARHEFLKRPNDLSRCELLHDAHAWVGMSEDAEWRHWLRQVGADGVDSSKGQFFTLANMSLEAALAHQGVAMGRSLLVKDLLEKGQLFAPLKQEIESPIKYRIVYPTELVDRPGLAAVIRWLHEQAASA